MKAHKSVLLAVVVAVLCLLFGCKQYSSVEGSRQMDAGRKLMQDYLDAYIPGGRILSVDLHEEALLGQGAKRHLTEYVVGTYSDADGSWWFEANTITGELYSSKTYNGLEQLIGKKILEQLGLGDDAEIAYLSKAPTLLPHSCEEFGHDIDSISIFGDPNTTASLDTIYFQNVTPIAMVDAEGFYARSDRQTLYIDSCTIRLPEGTAEPVLDESALPLCFDGVQVNSIQFVCDG